MRFILDESVEFGLLAFLESEGHDATAVASQYPQSLSDGDVLAIAYAEQRVVITNDSDFGELVFRHKLPHSGVIFFRLPPGDTAAKIEALRKALKLNDERVDRFVVIDRRGVRVR